jgi:hypothetical protein
MASNDRYPNPLHFCFSNLPKLQYSGPKLNLPQKPLKSESILRKDSTAERPNKASNQTMQDAKEGSNAQQIYQVGSGAKKILGKALIAKKRSMAV